MRVAVMARKRKNDTPEDTSQRSDEDPGVYSLKIEPDLVQPLKMVAAGLGMSTPNYVNSRLRIIVGEELPRIIAAMNLGKTDRDAEPKK